MGVYIEEKDILRLLRDPRTVRIRIRRDDEASSSVVHTGRITIFGMLHVT